MLVACSNDISNQKKNQTAKCVNLITVIQKIFYFFCNVRDEIFMTIEVIIKMINLERHLSVIFSEFFISLLIFLSFEMLKIRKIAMHLIWLILQTWFADVKKNQQWKLQNHDQQLIHLKVCLFHLKSAATADV